MKTVKKGNIYKLFRCSYFIFKFKENQNEILNSKAPDTYPGVGSCM